MGTYMHAIKLAQLDRHSLIMVREVASLIVSGVVFFTQGEILIYCEVPLDK